MKAPEFIGFAPLLASLLGVAGCSSDGATTGRAPSGFPEDRLPDELVADLPLIAPESDLDIPVFSDVVDVPAGSDLTFCTFTDVILDEDTVFRESFGSQSPTGHHAILQYVTEPQEPHTGPCGDAMDGQMLLGGTGGKAVADDATLPENFGVEVPAGAQLVINHHWINGTADSVQGQAMMLARRLPRDGDTVLAGNMIMIGIGWEIPARGPLEFTTECTYGADVPYVLALGHMHEWGRNVKVRVDRKAGGSEMLIDEDWNPDSATGAGGGRHFTLDDPYLIRSGDKVSLTCSWDNTTADPVGFPREMCIFFGYTIGANFVCANGYWLTHEQAAAAGAGDIGSHL